MTARVRTGLDRLAQGDCPLAAGTKVSLLCHPASQSAELEHARDVLARRCHLDIVSLLGPEHGLEASAQDMIGVHDLSSRPSETPGYSLYGTDEASLWPKPEYFHDAQWVVIDLQDVGVRYYTYIWTAVMVAEVALNAGLEVLLLDRPNPLGGEAWQVEGGAIQEGYLSFVGFHDVAVRHGMTLAEIVRMTLAERGEAGLEGLKTWAVQGWTREWMFHECGLPWVMPSPNMPTLLTACVYPGQCLFEGTLMSEGRGSTRPFELVGAPWIDARDWMARLDPELCPGIDFRPMAFEPTFQKLAGLRCAGLQLHVRDPYAVKSLGTSWTLLQAAYAQSLENPFAPIPGAVGSGPDAGRADSQRRFEWRSETYEFVSEIPAIDVLAGGPRLRAAVESGQDLRALLADQEPERLAFLERRSAYLLYPERERARSIAGSSALDLQVPRGYGPAQGKDSA